MKPGEHGRDCTAGTSGGEAELTVVLSQDQDRPVHHDLACSVLPGRIGIWGFPTSRKIGSSRPASTLPRGKTWFADSEMRL